MFQFLSSPIGPSGHVLVVHILTVKIWVWLVHHVGTGAEPSSRSPSLRMLIFSLGSPSPNQFQYVFLPSNAKMKLMKPRILRMSAECCHINNKL